MIDTAILPLKEHFRLLKDPRAQHSIDHLLLDMVLITICAVICGADTWGEIDNYGIAKQEWLKPSWNCPTESRLTTPLSDCLLGFVRNRSSNAF